MDRRTPKEERRRRVLVGRGNLALSSFLDAVWIRNHHQGGVRIGGDEEDGEDSQAAATVRADDNLANIPSTVTPSGRNAPQNCGKRAKETEEGRRTIGGGGEGGGNHLSIAGMCELSLESWLKDAVDLQKKDIVDEEEQGPPDERSRGVKMTTTTAMEAQPHQVPPAAAVTTIQVPTPRVCSCRNGVFECC